MLLWQEIGHFYAFPKLASSSILQFCNRPEDRWEGENIRGKENTENGNSKRRSRQILRWKTSTKNADSKKSNKHLWQLAFRNSKHIQTDWCSFICLKSQWWLTSSWLLFSPQGTKRIDRQRTSTTQYCSLLHEEKPNSLNHNRPPSWNIKINWRSTAHCSLPSFILISIKSFKKFFLRTPPIPLFPLLPH